MAGKFDGKVVVITGGSRGIGKGIGLAFAREGAEVVLSASSEPNLAAAAKEIAAGGGVKPAGHLAGDLRELAACEALHAHVKARHGRCDILVNSAGATRNGDFFELSDEQFLDGFALKFHAAVRLSRLFWPMLKEAQGNIVNIIGGAARTPTALFLIGGSVNAALANFSKGLSKRGMVDGVNVNAIHPGLTETDRQIDLARVRAEKAGIPLDKYLAEQVARAGLKRMGTPADIAATTLFLCSPEARHIVGAAIEVDGGTTPGMH